MLECITRIIDKIGAETLVSASLMLVSSQPQHAAARRLKPGALDPDRSPEQCTVSCDSPPSLPLLHTLLFAAKVLARRESGSLFDRSIIDNHMMGAGGQLMAQLALPTAGAPLRPGTPPRLRHVHRRERTARLPARSQQKAGGVQTEAAPRAPGASTVLSPKQEGASTDLAVILPRLKKVSVQFFSPAQRLSRGCALQAECQ